MVTLTEFHVFEVQVTSEASHHILRTRRDGHLTIAIETNLTLNWITACKYKVRPSSHID